MDDASATEPPRAAEARATAPRLLAAVVCGFFIFVTCLALLFATYEKQVPAAVLVVVSLSIATLGGWLVFKLFDGRLGRASSAKDGLGSASRPSRGLVQPP